MSVKDTHPLFDEYDPQWELLKNSYRGEDAVKEQTTTYLPATSGMLESGMNANQPGLAAYTAYILRALYPDVVRSAVQTMIGVMHRKPARYRLPKKLELYLERMTKDGESLAAFHRRLNEAQLVRGRMGMLLDLPVDPAASGPENLPHVVAYHAQNIINWDNGAESLTRNNLNLVVLDETSNQRGNDGFSWQSVTRHLVLSLGEFSENEGYWTRGPYTATTYDEGGHQSEILRPMFKGKGLDFIPFVFCNSSDLLPNPSEPPLLGLARLAMAIYRLEADYRQALFMQAQDTLVVTGEPKHDRRYAIGVGAVINLQNPQAKAEFIGVNSEGLAEMRAALENDKKLASVMSGQLVDTTSRSRESGDALKTRVSAQTATITQVAIAGAEALQTLLRMAATWVGASPDEVEIKPNMQFTDGAVSPRTLVEFATAKQMGIPISDTSIHTWMKKNGITEMDLEEELEALNAEAPKITGTNAGGEDPAFTEGDEEREEREDDPERGSENRMG